MASKTLVECSVCGKTLERENWQINANKTGIFFCSNACQKQYYSQKIQVKCEVCGKPRLIKPATYRGNKSKKFYCCREHMYDGMYNNRGFVTVNCAYCGKAKEVPTGYYNWRKSGNFFCDTSCQMAWQDIHKTGCYSKEARIKRGNALKGYKHSKEFGEKVSKAKKGITTRSGYSLTEEHKKKISEGNKGKRHSDDAKKRMSKAKNGIKLGPHKEETKQKISKAVKGKPKTMLMGVPRKEEVKRKISESLMGHGVTEESRLKMSVSHRGENWKPDYPLDFNDRYKDEIRCRDRNVCQLCGRVHKRGPRLDVHHIDWDKWNSERLNLISVCKNCHLKVHSPRDKKYWEEVLRFINLYNHSVELKQEVI